MKKRYNKIICSCLGINASKLNTRKICDNSDYHNTIYNDFDGIFVVSHVINNK